VDFWGVDSENIKYKWKYLGIYVMRNKVRISRRITRYMKLIAYINSFVEIAANRADNGILAVPTATIIHM
jgi:hypothetical protein